MLGQSIAIALGMLRLHKLRALLTMSGVIIGVMSVTIIVMLSQGFKEYIKGQFSKIGSDTIYAYFDQSRRQRGSSNSDIQGMKMEDLDFIKARVPSVEVASGYSDVGRHSCFYAGAEVKSVGARAIDAYFLTLNRIVLVAGRTLSESDISTRASVAIVSVDLAKELFGTKDAVGKVFRIEELTLEVIGVSEPAELMGDRQTKSLMLPITTAQSKWVGGTNIDLMVFRVKEGKDINLTMEEIWQALMIRSSNRPIYRVESSENILKVFQGIIGGAGTLLAGIAALSLLVGGIGIMNIMLVSVTERTKEIGLRKAVGAKNPAILTQFLVEAGVLSLVGGLIGMGIAYGMGTIVTLVTASRDWPQKGGLATPFPLVAAILAAAFSALIGMVFGFYPAAAAAKLDPIVALRRE